MKILRLFSSALIAILAITAWGPASVYAKPEGTSINNGGIFVVPEAAKTKMGSIIVDNKTGGTLYISLFGAQSYYFAASKQGKSTFGNIRSGKYRIVLTTSACGGSLTYTQNIKGKISLKRVVCRKR